MQGVGSPMQAPHSVPPQQQVYQHQQPPPPSHPRNPHQGGPGWPTDSQSVMSPASSHTGFVGSPVGQPTEEQLIMSAQQQVCVCVCVCVCHLPFPPK